MCFEVVLPFNGKLVVSAFVFSLAILLMLVLDDGY